MKACLVNGFEPHERLAEIAAAQAQLRLFHSKARWITVAAGRMNSEEEPLL